MDDIADSVVDVHAEERDLINEIAKISVTARQYLESGRILDDQVDPDELSVSLRTMLNQMVDILVAELEMLGMQFNEPLADMIGDLYRIDVLRRLRCAFDGDIFVETLKALPRIEVDNVTMLVQGAVEGSSDVSELVQQIIMVISSYLPMSDDWTLLAENVRLFASTHRLAEHLERVLQRYNSPDVLEGKPVEEISRLLVELVEQKQRFEFALRTLNQRYQKFNDDALILFIRDYEKDAPAVLTSAGVSNADLKKHRENAPYHFTYYSSRKLEYDMRALMLIASAIYATQYPNQVTNLTNVMRPYQLIYEVQTKLTEMVRFIPEMPKA